ncbi:hypothetical protein KJA15_03335 [Patescibacteria group bacterium]|nr:hypothetical protein [Patescibacteria group bacterium]
MKKKPKENFFGKRGYLSRRKFRERLRRASPFIPGSGGKLFRKKERVAMEKEIFRKYGHYIEKKEYKKALKDLKEAKQKTKTFNEKLKIDRKIRFLKKLGEI